MHGGSNPPSSTKTNNMIKTAYVKQNAPKIHNSYCDYCQRHRRVNYRWTSAMNSLLGNMIDIDDDTVFGKPWMHVINSRGKLSFGTWVVYEKCLVFNELTENL